MSQAFVVAGGLLFAGSLVFFAVSYVSGFDGGGPWSWVTGGKPLVIDVALFTIFAMHHSIFARRPFQRWIERIVRPELERSTYVWIASVLFLVVCAVWQPVPGTLWSLAGPGAVLMRGAQLCGAALAVVAARRLDALALAGVRQVLDSRPASEPSPEVVLDRGPYSLIRHPIYLGWFVMAWCAPVMNGTRLVFAAVSCLYLVIAIPFEERDLHRTLGASYTRYAQRVRWRVVPGIY